MANVVIDDNNLTDIASAIRDKRGSSDTYKPREMAAAIRAINTTEYVDPTINMRDIVHIVLDSPAIAANTFEDCVKLRSVESSAITVGERAFANCTPDLNHIYLRSVETIGTNAFYGCDITVLDVGDNAKSIDISYSYIEKLIIRNTVDEEGNFTVPTLISNYVPEDQRVYRKLYVPEIVKPYYEEAAATSGTNYDIFPTIVALENSSFATYTSRL